MSVATCYQNVRGFYEDCDEQEIPLPRVICRPCNLDLGKHAVGTSVACECGLDYLAEWPAGDPRAAVIPEEKRI